MCQYCFAVITHKEFLYACICTNTYMYVSTYVLLLLFVKIEDCVIEINNIFLEFGRKNIFLKAY